MSNMSYCRFENTLPDLRDCVESIENGDALSEDEVHCAKKMVQMCKDYIRAVKKYGITKETFDEDDGEFDVEGAEQDTE